MMSADRSFMLKPLVTTNCSIPIQTKYRWIFFKIDPDTNYFSPFIPFGLKDQNMTMLRPRLFGPGAFYVSVEILVTDNVTETSAYDFGFLRIRIPVLIAKIEAPLSITRGAGIVTIDGSGSHDTEYPLDQYNGLKFAWQCQRTCQNPAVKPCFTIANITNTGRLFEIDASSLKSNCTYVFNLTVTKYPRESKAGHKLHVKPEVQFYVR